MTKRQCALLGIIAVTGTAYAGTASPNEPNTLLLVIGGMAAVLSPLALWAWNHTHKRIDDAWEAIDQKAAATEMTMQRDHVAKIYGEIGALKVSVGKIEIQMERFIADIESEKRTRAEANKEINSKLDVLLRGPR